MPFATTADIARMRGQLFFEGEEQGTKLTRFWLLLVLASVIATAGVVGDSTATVIGAMIVAPLMVPILGIVLSVVLADRTNLGRSLGLVVSGAGAVVAVGWLIGLAMRLPVVAATNSQVSARVSPRLIDLIAALATGVVGSIALAREDISDTLPGVAISISLVPPLAVAGLTLESGATDEALGALLLFLTNVSAILTAGLVVMAVYRVRGRTFTEGTEGRTVNHRRAVAVIVGVLALICIPLGLTSRQIATTRTTESQITDLTTHWADGHGWDVTSVTTQPDGVVVRVTGPLPEPETKTLQASIAAAGLDDRHITIELIPSSRVELGPHED